MQAGGINSLQFLICILTSFLFREAFLDALKRLGTGRISVVV